MKTQWTGVFAAIVIATVGLNAQNPPPASPAAPPAAAADQAPAAPAAPAAQPSVRAAAQAADKVTLSGCVQRAPAAASADAPAAPASAASEMFVLADAKAAAAPGRESSPVGTAGTAASRYELDGEAKMISTHVNQKVEITGTVQSGPASATSTRAAAPKLKVESIKMTAATCS